MFRSLTGVFLLAGIYFTQRKNHEISGQFMVFPGIIFKILWDRSDDLGGGDFWKKTKSSAESLFIESSLGLLYVQPIS